MNSPRDRRLTDISDEEVDDVVITDAELPELKEFGKRLATAFELSGAPPSTEALDRADQTVVLPDESPGDRLRFNDGVRRRIEAHLHQTTGEESIGAWVRSRRRESPTTESAAATLADLPLAAYRHFEDGQMPVWRIPPTSFAHLCKHLAIDSLLLLRWAGVTASTTSGAVFGRTDLTGEDRSDLLAKLALESQQQSRQEFEAWRRDFIDAYGAASEDAAPSEQ